MKIKRFISASFLVFLSLQIVGCATTTRVGFSEIKNVLPRLTNDKARLFCYRPTKTFEIATPDFYINGARITSIAGGEIFYLELTPGRYTVNIIRSGSGYFKVFDLWCNGGENVYIEVNDKNSKIFPEIVTEDIASSKLDNLQYKEINGNRIKNISSKRMLLDKYQTVEKKSGKYLSSISKDFAEDPYSKPLDLMPLVYRNTDKNHNIKKAVDSLYQDSVYGTTPIEEIIAWELFQKGYTVDFSYEYTKNDKQLIELSEEFNMNLIRKIGKRDSERAVYVILENFEYSTFLGSVMKNMQISVVLTDNVTGELLWLDGADESEKYSSGIHDYINMPYTIVCEAFKNFPGRTTEKERENMRNKKAKDEKHFLGLFWKIREKKEPKDKKFIYDSKEFK